MRKIYGIPKTIFFPNDLSIRIFHRNCLGETLKSVHHEGGNTAGKGTIFIYFALTMCKFA